MPICHNKKIIFIHIPKNVAESIEPALHIYGRDAPAQWHGGDQRNLFWGTLKTSTRTLVLQHLTATELRQFPYADKIYEEYFKFAVISPPGLK